MASEAFKKTGFGQLHKLLEDNPRDRALRVDRDILVRMIHELMAAARKLEELKAADLLEEEEPLLWNKVNVMPPNAMVQFKHQAHIRAEVECVTCHGDVGQMTVAQQVINTADMGWCVGCHRENGASIDCLTCHH